MPTYDMLIPAFLEAMQELGEYGYSKHGVNSFQHQQKIGDHTRPGDRLSTEKLAHHSRDHFLAYQVGEKHDHFKTFKHQLAAVAYNAMMEFYFADLERLEPGPEIHLNSCIVCSSLDRRFDLIWRQCGVTFFVRCDTCGRAGGARSTMREAMEDWNFHNRVKEEKR